MKKILFALSAIAALTITSCTQDEPAQTDNDTIFAAIDALSTRTALEAAGDHYNINWVENDIITVSNGSKTALYKTTTGGSTVAEFKKTTWGSFTGDSFVGYYPSDISNGFLPYMQTYAEGNVFKVPMVSDVTTDPKTLVFKPVTGIVKLNLTTTAKDVKVKNITIKADQGFSGNYTMRDGVAVINDTDATMLDCGEGVAISGTATPFYLAVPANSYTNLEITVQATDGLVAVAKLQAGTTYTVKCGELREINVPVNSFTVASNGGVATLCYGVTFNEYVKHLVMPKKMANSDDSVITKISFLVNDKTVGQVKVNDPSSEYPIYISLNGTEVNVTTPASSIKTGIHAANLFHGMTKLKSIENLNIIDFSDNEDFSYMFHDCFVLQSIDLSNFVTDKSMSFAYMFSYCQKVKHLDVSKFKTDNALSLGFMFRHCESLEDIDVSKFKTDKCCNMDNCFSDCWVLKSLDLSGWNTDLVRETRSMFNRCKALKELDIRHMSFPSTTLMTYMFYQMENLEVLHIDSMDLSRWKEADIANQVYMFNYMPKLKEVFLGEKGYNEKTYKPDYLWCSTGQASGTRTASKSGSLTIHCSQKGADWLSQTNLRWINSGHSGQTAIPVKFLDYQTGAELTVSWAAN